MARTNRVSGTSSYSDIERRGGSTQSSEPGKTVFQGVQYEDERDYLAATAEIDSEAKLTESHRAYIDWTIKTAQQEANRSFSQEEQTDLFQDPKLKKMALNYVYSGGWVDPNDPRLDGDDDDDDQQLIKDENPLDIHVPRITAAQPKTLQENIDIMDEKLAGDREEAGKEEAYYKKEVEKQKQAYETLSNEIKTFKIDPFRAYESTMFSVTAGIAAAFGAAAQALTGGPNTGLQMVNRAIDMDIARQKHEYEALKSAAARQNTLYGKALEMFGSSKRAVQALKTLGLDLALRKTTSDLEKYGVDQAAADRYITNFTNAQIASANALFERRTKAELELEQGKAAMAEAYDKFNKVLNGYEALMDEDFGWFKVNAMSLFGASYPTLALKLTQAEDGSAIKDIVENQQSVAKLVNSLAREALKAGGEGAKISDADVKLTSAEILDLMPARRLVLFPREDIGLLRTIVKDWVEMKTGLSEAEVRQRYGRKGSTKYKKAMDQELSGMIRAAKLQGSFKASKVTYNPEREDKQKQQPESRDWAGEARKEHTGGGMFRY